MKQHDFTLVLESDWTDDQIEAHYERLDDGTFSTIAGVPRVDFMREAPTLEQAIQSAIADVRSAGMVVARVEIEPESLAPAG